MIRFASANIFSSYHVNSFFIKHTFFDKLIFVSKNFTSLGILYRIYFNIKYLNNVNGFYQFYPIFHFIFNLLYYFILKKIDIKIYYVI